ncbi:hypothetical protein Droror1_Dr00024109 [Drosera rotundifolia]
MQNKNQTQVVDRCTKAAQERDIVVTGSVLGDVIEPGTMNNAIVPLQFPEKGKVKVDVVKSVNDEHVDEEVEKSVVLYNVFREFQNKELYQNTFLDAEKQKKFLKWLVQFLERTVKKFDFGPTGINSLVLVNDLKKSPRYDKWDLHKVTNKFLQLLQDNYPEFVAK